MLPDISFPKTQVVDAVVKGHTSGIILRATVRTCTFHPVPPADIVHKALFSILLRVAGEARVVAVPQVRSS